MTRRREEMVEMLEKSREPLSARLGKFGVTMNVDCYYTAPLPADPRRPSFLDEATAAVAQLANLVAAEQDHACMAMLMQGAAMGVNLDTVSRWQSTEGMTCGVMVGEKRACTIEVAIADGQAHVTTTWHAPYERLAKR